MVDPLLVSPVSYGAGTVAFYDTSTLLGIAMKHFDMETSTILVGSVCFVVALLALHRLEKTFHKEFD